MGKNQQTIWLAGFAGLSVACVVSALLYAGPKAQTPSAPSQPHALLAANTDHDQTITLAEVRQMLEGHFNKLDTDSDGLIDRDEYAGRHIHLFTAIDSDQDQRLTPAEVRFHKTKSRLLYMTAYR